ncbi:MAG TPA: ABC transporter permease [Vicinamibacterales bacterium]|nr:ABC transporter permease [Vicinamibacterales bacterium]
MKKALAVGRKEFRQIVRDRRTLSVLLVVPILFLLLFGYALNWDVRHVRLAVDDQDHTTQSRDLVSAFVDSDYFDLVGAVRQDQIRGLMNRGDVRAVLVIPSGTGRRLLAGRTAPIQVLINGDDANTATTVMGYAQALLNGLSTEYRLARYPVTGRPPVTVEPRIWYNPELRSALFLVPGLIAYIAMLTAVISTALSVVREKELGTMEQVRMAPLGTLSYVTGKSLPYFLVSMISSLGIVVVAMWLFDLPMRGSWPLLVLAIALFLAGGLGLGLLVSTVSDSQQVAFQIAALVSFMPTLLLSGFIFPIASMPVWLQVTTYVVPARYFLVVLRGIVLKGVGLPIVWPDMLALVAFAGVVLGLAAVRLRREWA